MSVFFFKPRGTWAVQWTEEGKRVRRYFKTEQEASAYEQERLSPESSRLTVGELALAYFRSNATHEKTRSNIVSFLSGGGRYEEGAGQFLFGKYADALTRIDLERMRENMRNHGAGNNTINKYQAYLRAILAWGADQQLIPFNPWRDFKRLRVEQKVISISFYDVLAVYRAAPDWLQWAIKTCYCLSLRPGKTELFSLIWTSFIWHRHCVVIKQGKSGKLKTVYPPDWYLREAAERYKKDCAAGLTLVCHRSGRAVNNYRTAWDSAVHKAGLPHFPMYGIRHAAATEMLAAGADLASVAAQLGHSTVTTTGTFYAHVTAGGQQRAAALMPGFSDKKP